MSEPALSIGFFGKLPARGDFVRAGLPRRFTDPWDFWLQATLVASRAQLGPAFLPAWLEAPVWHCALAPGVCGPDAVLAVWLPSVDRVGRPFPLTLARIGLPGAVVHGGAAFLAGAQQAGLAALTEDVTPEALGRRLPVAPAATADDPQITVHGSRWWTEGGPRVPAACLAWPGLPDPGAFHAMLDAGVQ